MYYFIAVNLLLRQVYLLLPLLVPPLPLAVPGEDVYRHTKPKVKQRGIGWSTIGLLRFTCSTSAPATLSFYSRALSRQIG